jgi:hypothetical protein
MAAADALIAMTAKRRGAAADDGIEAQLRKYSHGFVLGITSDLSKLRGVRRSGACQKSSKIVLQPDQYFQ